MAYVRQRSAAVDLRIVNADGSAPAESLRADSKRQLWQALFVAGGRAMVVRTIGDSTGRDLWRVALDSGGPLQPLLHSPADEASVTVSPDGHWMAYQSDESGRQEIYVRSFPGMGARYQVSLEGGTEPVWSPVGREIFFRTGPLMTAAEVRTSPGFEVLRRTSLFSSPDFVTSAAIQEYDVAPDGQHFVMVRTLGSQPKLMVTLNWFQNLRAGTAGVAGAAGR